MGKIESAREIINDLFGFCVKFSPLELLLSSMVFCPDAEREISK